MAMLLVLFVILGLLVVGQMVMLLMDHVTRRSGQYRRGERGQYCAEEGLNLGRAWVLSEIALNNGGIPAALLSGMPKGMGLLADPANPDDFRAKDLCSFPSMSETTLGGVSFYGLGGGLGQSVCRLDSSLTYCGSPPCPIYRINLVDDIDELPSGTLDPYTDENMSFFIRAECMLPDDSDVSGFDGGVPEVVDAVATMEIMEAGGGNCYGPGGSGAGCGGGYAN